MSIGPAIRRLLGSREALAADIYRGFFVSLSDLARQMNSFRPRPHRILEIGCGEGAMATLLSRSYPNSEITAIDISPAIGRLYSGRKDHVSFRQENLQQFIANNPHTTFDLVVMVDVMHHIQTDRLSLLLDIRRILANDGGFILKDLNRGLHPVFLLAHFADYYIGGDHKVRYHSIAEFLTLLTTAFGVGATLSYTHVRPWQSNVVFFIEASEGKSDS